MNIVTATIPPETPGPGVPVLLDAKPVEASPPGEISLNFKILIDRPGLSAQEGVGEVQAEQWETIETGQELPGTGDVGKSLPVSLSVSLPHSMPVLGDTQTPIDPAQTGHGGTDSDIAAELRPAVPNHAFPASDDVAIQAQFPPSTRPQSDLSAPVSPERPTISPASQHPVLPTPPVSKTDLITLVPDETSLGLEPVRPLPERAVAEMIQRSADNPHITQMLDPPQLAIARVDHITSSQSQPVPTTHMSSTAPLGQQIETLIDNLVHTREISRAARSDMTLRHPDFGAIAVGLERAESDLRAVLSSRDPGFASAAQSALAERAVAAAADPQSASSRGHNETPGQHAASRDAGGSAQGDQRGQHQPADNKQQHMPAQTREQRAHPDLAEAGTPSNDQRDDGILA